jgi:hypothetical protein
MLLPLLPADTGKVAPSESSLTHLSSHSMLCNLCGLEIVLKNVKHESVNSLSVRLSKETSFQHNINFNSAFIRLAA